MRCGFPQGGLQSAQILSPLRLCPAQHQTRRTRFRNRPPVLVRHFALHISDALPAPHHFPFRSQLRLPHRPKKIDLQLHRRKRFPRRQRRMKRNPHRRIRDIAQNSAMRRPHRIRMLRPPLERPNRTPLAPLRHFKSNQLRHRHDLSPSRTRLSLLGAPLSSLLRHASSLISRAKAYTNPRGDIATIHSSLCVLCALCGEFLLLFPRPPAQKIPIAHSTRYNPSAFLPPRSTNVPDASPQSSHSFHLNTYRVDGATVVECHGKLISDHAPKLRNEVRNLLPAEKRIIIDMKNVHHMDSSGLGALATLYVHCRTRGCKLELINLNQATRSLLSMTNLLSLFEDAGRFGGKLP